MLALETSEYAMIFLPPLLYWSVSSLFYTLSRLNLTAVELHRIPTSQKMRTPNRVSEKKVLIQVFVQHVIQCAAAFLLVVVTRPEDISSRPLESPPLLILKLILGALILDTYQYWWHRAMHENKWLYRNFHQVHHQLTVPYAFGALYNHIVEGFIMDTIGGGVPAMILDMHPWTATIFFCVATVKTVDDHCGYSFAWDPLQMIFPNNAAYHDVHHWGKGRMYNYSQWMGTHYDTEMLKKQIKKGAELKAEEMHLTPTLLETPLDEKLHASVMRRVDSKLD